MKEISCYFLASSFLTILFLFPVIPELNDSDKFFAKSPKAYEDISVLGKYLSHLFESHSILFFVGKNPEVSFNIWILLFSL